jgi:hypothetical protein
MGIFDLWRQARGAVMRKEFEDTMARMEGANDPAKSAFLNNVNQTIDEVINACTSASESERKALLKQMKEASLQMWKSGDWPSALGLAISCLNAESRFVPGEDALYVRHATDRIIQEAKTAA